MAFTPATKKILLLATTTAIVAGVSLYNKVVDLKDNVKFFIDNFRVHGLVNITNLRLFTTVRIVNQAQSNLNVNDLQVFIQYIDPTKNIIDLGASIQSTNISIPANNAKTYDVGTDLSLLSIPYGRFPGLLKGEKITVRILTSFTAFGKRITVPTDQALQIPSAIISFINVLLPKK
jgi:LEA14-like dessication related protein